MPETITQPEPEFESEQPTIDKTPASKVNSDVGSTEGENRPVTVTPEGDDFAQAQKDFANGISGEDGINYVFSRYERESKEAGLTENPFAPLSSESSAALLLRIDQLIDGQPDMKIDGDTLSSLRQRITTDASAAKLYFAERSASMTNEQMMLEADLASKAIQSGEDISGHQLRVLLERANEMGVTPSEQTDSEFAENVAVLRKEYDKHTAQFEGAIVAIKETDSSTEQSVAAAFFAGVNKVEVSKVTNDGESLVVQSTTPDGNQVETTLKKPDAIKTFLSMALSDALLGTRKLEQVGGEVLRTSLSPILEKWGIDPSFFFDTMNYGKYEVFDQFLNTLTTDQCEQFFKKALETGSLPKILEQCHPKHIKKIFNPDGTQKFGSHSAFSPDIHSLPQDLVEKMRASLTDRQKTSLRLPEAKVKTT